MINTEKPNILKRYNISINTIIIASIIIILIIFRFFVQKDNSIVIYTFFSNIYSDILIFGVKFFLLIFKNNFIYDFVSNSILVNKELIKIDRFFFSLNQIMAIFIVVLITKSKIFERLLFFAIGFFVIFLYNIIRISLHLFFPETVAEQHWFFNVLLIPRWIFVIIFIKIYWKRNTSVIDFIIKKSNLTQEFFNSFFKKLIFANIIYFIIIIWAFSDVFVLNGELFVSFILKSSQSLLDIFGYESTIRGRYIFSQNANLYMDDACIGINLMFLFAVFIVLLPGEKKHKFWYIPTGILTIIFLNISRIVFIFINLTKNKGDYKLPIDIHDVFTYPVLVFTFIMWAIWINKFVIIEKNKTIISEKKIDENNL